MTETIISMKDYILLYLMDKKPQRIPSVRFWAIALLATTAGLKIQMEDGHILTTEDCFIEMNDCASGNCNRLDQRGRIKLWLYQKRIYYGWRKENE